MSNTKHTPGPWTHEASCVGEREGYIVAPSHEVVAWIRSTQPDAPANARLIAAAPDLLAALRHIANLAPSAASKAVRVEIERMARDVLTKLEPTEPTTVSDSAVARQVRAERAKVEG